MKESVPCTAIVNRDSDKYEGDLFQVTVSKFIRRDEKIKRCGHDWQLPDRQSNRIRHEYVSTWLFIITWQISQNRYTWVTERTCICDPHKARETLQVYLYAPREFIFVGDRQGSRLSENGCDGSTEGAASLATKIAWPNTMRFFLWKYVKGCLSTVSTTRSAAKTNHRCHLRNQSRLAAAGKGGNGLSAWRLPCRKGRTTDLLWSKKKKRKKIGEFLSNCSSHVTILSATRLRILRNVSGSYE